MPDPISITCQSVPQALYWKSAQAIARTKTPKDTRHFVWTVVGWIVILAVTILLLRTDLVPDGSAALGIGFFMGFLTLVFFNRLQQSRLNSILDADQTRRGPTDAVFSDNGIMFRSSFGEICLNWRAVDDVVDLGPGTGIRPGVQMYPLADNALPAGMTPDAFRAALRDWAGLS